MLNFDRIASLHLLKDGQTTMRLEIGHQLKNICYQAPRIRQMDASHELTVSWSIVFHWSAQLCIDFKVSPKHLAFCLASTTSKQLNTQASIGVIAATMFPAVSHFTFYECAQLLGTIISIYY